MTDQPQNASQAYDEAQKDAFAKPAEKQPPQPPKQQEQQQGGKGQEAQLAQLRAENAHLQSRIANLEGAPTTDRERFDDLVEEENYREAYDTASAIQKTPTELDQRTARQRAQERFDKGERAGAISALRDDGTAEVGTPGPFKPVPPKDYGQSVVPKAPIPENYGQPVGLPSHPEEPEPRVDENPGKKVTGPSAPPPPGATELHPHGDGNPVPGGMASVPGGMAPVDEAATAAQQPPPPAPPPAT